MNCPINERTGDGALVGRCWMHLKNYVCPRHGNVKKNTSILKNRRTDKGRKAMTKKPTEGGLLGASELAAKQLEGFFEAINSLDANNNQAAAERDALKEENERIRKILSFVPAQAVIEAKEKAGYGTPVKAASISFGIQPNEDEEMFKGRYEDNIEWPK